MARRLAALAVPVAALAFAVPPAHAGANAAALQVALHARGLYGGTIDGVAGPATIAGVRRFQARRGLAVDGIAGPATRRALGRHGRPSLGRRAIVRGDRGWDVAALQFLLETHGFPLGPVDGILGARGTGFHPGLDFPAPAGRVVHAAGHGCVSFAGWNAGGYGNLVIVDHRRGMTSWYAHLSSIAVRAGRCVVAGTRIGRVGATGFATGPHLHFELRVRGAAVNPLSGL